MSGSFSSAEIIKRAEKKIRAVFSDAQISVNEPFNLEMNSDGDVNVKGIDDVSEYNDSQIFLVSRDFFVEIKGKNLKMSAYSKTDTVINGEIYSIDFTKR